MTNRLWLMVHGNAAVAENAGDGLQQVDGISYTDRFGQHKGWGSTWCADNHEHWFHFPITTPAVTDLPDAGLPQQRPQLTRVGVQFHSDNHLGFIDYVDVWDRGHRVFSSDPFRSNPLRLNGDYSDEWVTTAGGNVLPVPDHPWVSGGLSVSVMAHWQTSSKIFFANIAVEIALAPGVEG